MKYLRRLTLLILSLALVLTLTPSAASAAGSGEGIGYYPAWAPGQGYTPENIPAERFTQINYAFAAIENGRAALEDPAREGKTLAALTALRARHSGLRIALSVGGWDESTYFSDAAASDASRELFAQSCVDLLTAYDLDGVDLDWEYPVSGGVSGIVHRTQDRENFTLLLKALRAALDRQGKRDGKRYTLSIAGAMDSGYLRCIEPQAVAETVDHIFLMAYDFHGPWDAYADFNAPLYTPSAASPQYRGSLDSGISAWLSSGVPAGKLVLGMPLYGYIYQGVSSANSGLFSAYRSASSISWDKVKSEYLSNSSYRRLRHPEAQVPYLYGNEAFVSYDDQTSAAAKAALARQRGLGGIGFWELSQDRSGDLIRSAFSEWGGSISSPPEGARFRDVAPDAWYAGAVEFVCGAGLMNGAADGSFSPGASVTRGQITAILYRLAGEPAAQQGSAFSDVSASSYYRDAVVWAARRGIVTGFADRTFRPDLPVSRQQLAAILWRYAGWAKADSGERASLAGYPDAGEVSGYAQEAMRWALRAGVLQGTAGGTLLPGGSAARGQAAVMLQRFCGLLQ